MKHVFVVNKISGKGIAYRNIPVLKKVCEEKNLDYIIEVTQYPGHCQEIIEKYNNEKDIILYSVGGDGTILDVINSVNPSIPVGILPCGSGNDFYRYFGGVNTNFEKLFNDTIDAKPINVDIGQSDKMKFINTTSLGIDAKINFEASKLIRKSFITKGPAYGLSIGKNVIVLKASKVKMLVDDKDMSGEYYIISCMNGKYYGNGVKAAPSAVVNDGHFDLVLFKKANRIKAYKALVKYLSGKATQKDGVEIIPCKHLVIDSNEDMNIQSDGENYISKHLEIKILENYLKIKIAK